MRFNFAHVPSLTCRIQPSSKWKPGQGREAFKPYFLIGCPDDRMHLHTLARLCLIFANIPLA